MDFLELIEGNKEGMEAPFFLYGARVWTVQVWPWLKSWDGSSQCQRLILETDSERYFKNITHYTICYVIPHMFISLSASLNAKWRQIKFLQRVKIIFDAILEPRFWWMYCVQWWDISLSKYFCSANEFACNDPLYISFIHSFIHAPPSSIHYSGGVSQWFNVEAFFTFGDMQLNDESVWNPFTTAQFAFSVPNLIQFRWDEKILPE